MRPARRSSPWLAVLALTAAIHLVLGWAGGQMLPHFGGYEGKPVPVSLVILQPPDEDEEPEDVEDEDPLDLDGQLVELAEPKDPETPEDAEYLASHDQVVDKQTRSERFDINPEVVAPEWSRESRLEYEDLIDLNVDQPSTGAKVGNDRFDPDRDGRMAALPSPWLFTNKDGMQDPVAASHTVATLSGAPQNDLIDEERSDRVALTTKEFLFHSYLTRIRRLVNFYWQRNIDDLPRSVHLVRDLYRTDVEVVLDGDGGLESIVVTDVSGVGELDDCVVRAYKLAGPFPNPPEGLIEKDGRVYLPSMSWTVEFKAAANQFQGIDPNAGVQYPGLLKSPR